VRQRLSLGEVVGRASQSLIYICRPGGSVCCRAQKFEIRHSTPPILATLLRRSLGKYLRGVARPRHRLLTAHLCHICCVTAEDALSSLIGQEPAYTHPAESYDIMHRLLRGMIIWCICCANLDSVIVDPSSRAARGGEQSGSGVEKPA